MQWSVLLRSVDRVLLDAIYPPRCALCGVLGPRAICHECADDFEAMHRDVVRPFPPDALAFHASAFLYRGRAAQAVRRLKYERATSLVKPMSERISVAAEELGILDADAIVPVPIHWRRRCTRGFNQSELLASTLPRESLRTNLLRRTRYTRPQVGLSITQRQSNLDGAFQCLEDVTGMRILLVDDVFTSGGTARACARALADAGASEVGILTFAGWGDRATDPTAPIDWI